jgi:hypothetical protein
MSSMKNQLILIDEIVSKMKTLSEMRRKAARHRVGLI